MKKFIIRTISFVICAVMVLSFVGCGEKKVYVDVMTVLTDSKLANGAGAENEYFKMSWNTTSKCVVFTDKATGAEWSTTPSNFLNAAEKPARPRNYLESPLIIEYFDVNLGEPDTVRAYNHSLKDNTYSATLHKDEAGNDTITVQYCFKEINLLVPVDYKLIGDHFQISIDTSKIIENENIIYSIKLAPYLCSVEGSPEDSYLFYPSGTGVLIDTSDATLKEFSYSTEVYGPDAARKIKEKLTNDKNIYLPVYGVKNGDNALMGVVSSGAEHASLILNTRDKITNYSRIAPEFYIRGYDYNTVKGNLTYDETSIYADEGVTGSVLALDFYTLSGEKADYVGMAQKYQEVLFGNNTGKVSDDAFSLKIAGGVMQEKSFLGYPYSELFALTTFNQAKTMLEELSVTGVTPNVQFYGFGDTGLDVGKVAGNFKLASAFGSKDEIQALMAYCTEKGIDAYMDFNLTTYIDSGAGYSGMFDTAKTANSQAAYQYYISKTVQTQESELYDRFRLLKRDSVKTAGTKLLKKIAKYELSGISFASLSDTAYSDYTSPDYYMKKDFGKMVQEIVAPYKDQGYSFAANGANAYAAAIADVIFEAPLNSSEYDIYGNDVPFYQLVFKGKVELTSESVNAGESIKKKQLQALETGSSMLYTLYNTYDSTLPFTPFKNLYGAVYASNKQNIIDTANEYKDYYSAIGNSTIADHEILNNDGTVRLTTFSNGVKIYVNYSKTEFAGADFTVPAMDCLIIK